mgnify:CR=1 FL=1
MNGKWIWLCWSLWLAPGLGAALANTLLAGGSAAVLTVGAALFLGEKLGPRRIAGVVVAMIGAMIIIRPGMAVFTPAAFLPLCCAVCYAASALLTRKVGMTETAWTPMFYGALFGTIATSATLAQVSADVEKTMQAQGWAAPRSRVRTAPPLPGAASGSFPGILPRGWA